MNSKILIKRSLVSGSIPTTASLDVGELALNVSDVKLYTRSGSAIVPLNKTDEEILLVISESDITPKSVETSEFRLDAGTVSMIFTGSINTGIFGTTEYIQPYISTTQYSGMTVEYLAQRPNACRMGIIMASWLDTASIVFTDISTTDIGDTSDISFRFLSSSNELRLRVNSDGSGSGAWTVQSLFKLFPNLTRLAIMSPRQIYHYLVAQVLQEILPSVVT